MIALALVLFLLGAIALVSVRLFSGPTLYDRALAAHAIVLLAALAAAAVGAGVRQGFWIDAAIALVIADFVLAAAMLKYFRFRSLQTPMTRVGAAEAEQ